MSIPSFRGLAAQLGAGSVAIVLVAVIVVAASSIGLLGRLGEQQALARVQLAGASAREYLRRINEDALSNARILAERPALLRILTQGQSRELEPILRRFCETSGMDGCAAFEDDQLIASGGANVLWDEVQAAHLEQGERFLVAPRTGGAIITGASARVGRGRDINVIAIRLVNQRMIREMREQVAAQVKVTNFATYAAPADDPFTELHSAALSSGRSEVRRVKALDAYAATALLTASTGEMIGLIDTRSTVLSARSAGESRSSPLSSSPLPAWAAFCTGAGWCGRSLRCAARRIASAAAISPQLCRPPVRTKSARCRPRWTRCAAILSN